MSNVEQLAMQVAARIRDRSVTPEELQRILRRAAMRLVQPLAEAEEQFERTLFSPSQREALILHAHGLTCQQIAQQLGATEEAVFKDLVAAFMRLRPDRPSLRIAQAVHMALAAARTH